MLFGNATNRNLPPPSMTFQPASGTGGGSQPFTTGTSFLGGGSSSNNLFTAQQPQQGGGLFSGLGSSNLFQSKPSLPPSNTSSSSTGGIFGFGQPATTTTLISDPFSLSYDYEAKFVDLHQDMQQTLLKLESIIRSVQDEHDSLSPSMFDSGSIATDLSNLDARSVVIEELMETRQVHVESMHGQLKAMRPRFGAYQRYVWSVYRQLKTCKVQQQSPTQQTTLSGGFQPTSLVSRLVHDSYHLPIYGGHSNDQVFWQDVLKEMTDSLDALEEVFNAVEVSQQEIKALTAKQAPPTENLRVVLGNMSMLLQTLHQSHMADLKAPLQEIGGKFLKFLARFYNEHYASVDEAISRHFSC